MPPIISRSLRNPSKSRRNPSKSRRNPLQSMRPIGKSLRKKPTKNQRKTMKNLLNQRRPIRAPSPSPSPEKPLNENPLFQQIMNNTELAKYISSFNPITDPIADHTYTVDGYPGILTYVASYSDSRGDYYIFTDQDGNEVQLYAPQTIREARGVPAVRNAISYRSDSEDSDDNRMSRR